MPPQNLIDTHTRQIAIIFQSLSDIEAKQTMITNHINQWVAKIQGIDSVAFAALALHDGKPFKLDETTAKKAHDEILAVVEEMGRYRDEAVATAEKAAKAEAKKPKPLRLSVPRTPKNGSVFVPKKKEPNVKGSDNKN